MYNDLNDTFDNIFVILLKDSVRERRIKQRFDGLNYEIVYGVDGTKDVDKQHYESKGSKLTYGQLGCSLSHVNIYKKMVDEDIEMALILEDDCIFNDNLKNFNKYYNSLPKDWDMIYVGYLRSNVRPNIDNIFYKVELVKSGHNYDHRYGHICGTHCIVLKKDFAEKMYNFNKDGLYTADGAFTAYLKEYDANMYAFFPSMANQDNIECLAVNVDKEMIKLTGSHTHYMERKNK